MLTIERLDAKLAEADLQALAGLLIDAVAGNASIGYPAGLSRAEAREFWQDVGSSIGAKRLIVLVARIEGEIRGTVQLVFPSFPNGRRRAEVAKLLVHSSVRRRGIGAALMHAVEDEARRAGRTLLVLDTETESAAELMYAKLGWTLAGVIPEFAFRPDGRLRPSSFFYKVLTPS